MIDTRQKLEGWDSGVIPHRTAELKRGQERNIDLMTAFYQDCPDSTVISPQAAAKLGAVAVWKSQLLDSQLDVILPQVVAKLGAVAVRKSQPVDNQSDIISPQPAAKLRQRFNFATSGGEIRR